MSTSCRRPGAGVELRGERGVPGRRTLAEPRVEDGARAARSAGSCRCPCGRGRTRRRAGRRRPGPPRVRPVARPADRRPGPRHRRWAQRLRGMRGAVAQRAVEARLDDCTSVMPSPGRSPTTTTPRDRCARPYGGERVGADRRDEPLEHARPAPTMASRLFALGSARIGTSTVHFIAATPDRVVHEAQLLAARSALRANG